MANSYDLRVHDEKGRLDKYISDKIPDLSRTRVKELVKDGNILVNSKKKRFLIKYKKMIKFL